MSCERVSLVLLFVAVCLPAALLAPAPAPLNATEDQGWSAGLKVMQRAVATCWSEEETASCLKQRALRLADKVLETQDTLPLGLGLSLVRSGDEGRALEETQSGDVDELLLDRVGRLVNSRSLEFSMPRFFQESRQFVEQGDVAEARGKLKKLIGPLVAIGIVKGSMFAYALKALALLAGKALVVAKIALAISALIGLSKLFHHGHSKTTYEIVKHPHVSSSHTYSSSHVGGGHYGGGGGGGGDEYSFGGGEGGYGRSLGGDEDAHTMAYKEQAPVSSTKSDRR